MTIAYVIVSKYTGDYANDRLYFNVTSAKIALRGKYPRSFAKYAVARIGSAATVVAEIDEDGRWRDVA